MQVRTEREGLGTMKCSRFCTLQVFVRFKEYCIPECLGGQLETEKVELVVDAWHWDGGGLGAAVVTRFS